MNRKKTLSPVHPGEILLHDFLEPLELSQNKLAVEIKVPPRRINEIVLGKRGITADTALRLSLFFGTSPDLWLNLQSSYALDCIRLKEGKELQKTIKEFHHAIA
jgi:addiction module HigA family antidote